MKNSAFEKWRRQQASLGAWINLPDMHITETLARTGVDWLCFDLQHGLMDTHDLHRLLPAISGHAVTPVVRVATNTPDQIGKALDAGAEALIVPMVNNATDAADAVSACYYPPLGLRSCGPLRPALLHGFGYLAEANQQIACIAMIETSEGLANVDEIAATEGVDGLFIGPMDLCFGLGIAPGDFGNSLFTDAVENIVAACRRHNKVVGMFGYTPEMARDYLAQGFNFASAGTDISFFRLGMSQALSVARGEDAKKGPQAAGY